MRSTVGSGGRNLSDDVREVQQLLSARAQWLALPRLTIDGRCTGTLVRAIRRFEILALRMKRSDGRIEPGGRTYAALKSTSRSAIGRQRADSAAALAILSGPDWWVRHAERHDDSDEMHELRPAFDRQLRDMIAALRRGGATVVVRSTRHDAARAYIGHWAWQVANGTTSARHVPEQPGAPIIWDHGDELGSRFAAREMLNAEAIETLPPLESAHIDGNAAELTIDWSGTIRVFDAYGMPHRLDWPRRADVNPELRRIARSFGIAKDRVHPGRWLARATASDLERNLIDA